MTERKITSYVNRKTAPIGMPEETIEKCLDLKTGKKILISRKVHEYSLQGYLLHEDHYDGNNCYAYSLSWKYDKMGNVIEETDALGYKTVREYDKNGNKIYERKLHLTYYEHYFYDFSNRLVSVEEIHDTGEIYKTTNEYNLLSQCVGTTDHFSNQTQHQYDKLGRLVKTIHPDICSTKGQPFTPVEENI